MVSTPAQPQYELHVWTGESYERTPIYGDRIIAEGCYMAHRRSMPNCPVRLIGCAVLMEHSPNWQEHV